MATKRRLDVRASSYGDRALRTEQGQVDCRVPAAPPRFWSAMSAESLVSSPVAEEMTRHPYDSDSWSSRSFSASNSASTPDRLDRAGVSGQLTGTGRPQEASAEPCRELNEAITALPVSDSAPTVSAVTALAAAVSDA
jgi:hypothetical protein